MATTIKIGHAAHSEGYWYDENGKKIWINGQPGDQTGQEVAIAENFSIVGDFKPNFVLRPKTKRQAVLSAKACEDGCRNANVGYGQSNRNTLRDEAAKVNYDLSKITTPCNTDCSAFMTLCAVAGGSKVDYGVNAPSTRSMRWRFYEVDDYEILEDALHLECTDYLKRGDILVDEDEHTVMVLENGCQMPESSAIKIALDVTSIEPTKIFVKADITKIEDGIELPVEATAEDIALYSWEYRVSRLDSNKNGLEAGSLKLNMNTGSSTFSLTGLIPGKPYVLNVVATKIDGEAELRSANVIFYTPPVYAPAVETLCIESNSTDPVNKNWKVSFTAPSFPEAGYKPGYRVCLFKNGKVIGASDTLISTAGKYEFLLQNIEKDLAFSINDSIQIGIQPWLKDDEENFIIDSSALRCSEAVYIRNILPVVDKIFIKIANIFKRAILYNNNQRGIRN